MSAPRVVTLEGVLAKTLDDGGCLVWQGRHNGQGTPKIGEKSARRIVWELAKGPIPAGKVLTITCETRMCVCPDHLALTTYNEVAYKTAHKPDVHLRRSAMNARNARRLRAKITMETARHIRASDEGSKDLAVQFGVSRSLIQKVRANLAWVEHSSPWAGLGGRV